jgi:hypothetical protein
VIKRSVPIPLESAENLKKEEQTRLGYQYIFTPSEAHAEVKKPAKLNSCTHFPDDFAAANNASSFDR